MINETKTYSVAVDVRHYVDVDCETMEEARDAAIDFASTMKPSIFLNSLNWLDTQTVKYSVSETFMPD